MRHTIPLLIGLSALLASTVQASQEQLAKSIQDARAETARTSDQLKATLTAMDKMAKALSSEAK